MKNNNQQFTPLEITGKEKDSKANKSLTGFRVSPSKIGQFDFKSRGYAIKEDTHMHYQHQIDLYALLFEKNNLPPADYGYLLFFYPTSYAEGTANFETELVKMDVSSKRGYEVLEKVHQIITGPAPQSHADCKYCQYRSFQTSD